MCTHGIIVKYTVMHPTITKFGHWVTTGCKCRVVTKISSCWVYTTSRRGIKQLGISFGSITEKNNRFPFLDILGYLKNTHKNPTFGRVRQVPIRELGWEFPCWDLSHCGKFGIFMGYSLNTLKYPNMGFRYFFLCIFLLFSNEISQRSHS